MPLGWCCNIKRRILALNCLLLRVLYIRVFTSLRRDAAVSGRKWWSLVLLHCSILKHYRVENMSLWLFSIDQLHTMSKSYSYGHCFPTPKETPDPEQYQLQRANAKAYLAPASINHQNNKNGTNGFSLFEANMKV